MMPLDVSVSTRFTFRMSGDLPVGPGPHWADDGARAKALQGFRLQEIDLSANASGYLSVRQRMRTLVRAIAYGLGLVLTTLIPAVGVISLFRDGLSLKSIVLVILGSVFVLGVTVYAWHAWKDALSNRVLALDGVPEKRVERSWTESGFVWKFPYLLLEGEHKLGWHAYNAIQSDRAYRLYILPVSGRCVAAVPLDLDPPRSAKPADASGW